jgi:electron transfer flavoprotein alpha subunit
MKASDYIISINKDAAAPIIKYSDVALIGDAYDIVPKLIDSIRKGKQQLREGKMTVPKN